MSPATITLDVRNDLRQGREPFARIMEAVARMSPGEVLLLLAPFEPVPLFQVLARQGFTHTTRRAAGGDWEILFKRDTNGTPEAEAPVHNAPGRRLEQGGQEPSRFIIDLDARRLEPPQPLVAILEALASLPEGAELRAQTDRRPLHLYPQLEERGFTGQTEETTHGSFITHIRRR